jgi:hypothetical protein
MRRRRGGTAARARTPAPIGGDRRGCDPGPFKEGERNGHEAATGCLAFHHAAGWPGRPCPASPRARRRAAPTPPHVATKLKCPRLSKAELSSYRWQRVTEREPRARCFDQNPPAHHHTSRRLQSAPHLKA